MPGDAADATLTRRACERLGLPPDALDATVRATTCRQLLAADFLPDPTLHEAILIALGRPVDPAGSLVMADAEAATRRAVEAFAADFFALPVPDRQARWRALWASANDSPRLVARLDRLRAGLTVAPSTIAAADPQAEWLLDDLMNLFVAPAADRPARLRAMVARLDAKPKVRGRARARAIRSVRRDAPALAEAGRDYIDRIKPSRVIIGLVALVVALYAASVGMSRWMPPPPVAPGSSALTPFIRPNPALHPVPAAPR